MVFCENDDLNPAKAKAVCLYQNQWHALLISRRGIAAVGHPLPHIHQYDLDSLITTLEEAVGEPARPPTPDHDKEQPTSPTTETTSTPPPLQNQQLRLAPIPDAIRTSPVISPVMAATATTATYQAYIPGSRPQSPAPKRSPSPH